MGLLTPTVAKGRPVKTAKNTLMYADNWRANILEAVPLMFGIGVLYDMAFIQGNPDQTWSIGDILLVYLIGLGMKRVSVSRRWS